jgi:hypothetical protein
MKNNFLQKVVTFLLVLFSIAPSIEIEARGGRGGGGRGGGHRGGGGRGGHGGRGHGGRGHGGRGRHGGHRGGRGYGHGGYRRGGYGWGGRWGWGWGTPILVGGIAWGLGYSRYPYGWTVDSLALQMQLATLAQRDRWDEINRKIDLERERTQAALVTATGAQLDDLNNRLSMLERYQDQAQDYQNTPVSKEEQQKRPAPKPVTPAEYQQRRARFADPNSGARG